MPSLIKNLPVKHQYCTVLISILFLEFACLAQDSSLQPEALFEEDEP